MFLLALMSAIETLPGHEADALIQKADAYTVRVTAPGVDLPIPFRATTDGRPTHGAGWVLVPSFVRRTTAATGAGEVRLTFTFPGRPGPVVLRSKGLAEDVYLLRHLGGERQAAKWLDAAVPASKLVVRWPDDHPWGRPEYRDPPAGLAAAVALGKAAYDAKRPELVRRITRDSLLLLPPAAAAHWDASFTADTLTLDTRWSDRMYFALVRVELRKTAKGEWEVTRVLADEILKGE
ncbi:MAG: hypothetical protein C0501_19450 [Isosphaera sp.]|nr:hypothetical protein [Isosphaera sp.]